MAHFAELDNDNNVIRVVVISNQDLLDENGVEQEELGIAVCNQVIGESVWVQTSYNNNYRKIFALPGYKYAPDKDVFYNPVGPFQSWILDSNYDWQTPTPKPDDGNDYYWDEDSLTWVAVPTEEPAP